MELITLPSVLENVLFAKALDIKHRSAGTKLRQDHLMQEERRLVLILELELELIQELEQKSLAKEPGADRTKQRRKQRKRG